MKTPPYKCKHYINTMKPQNVSLDCVNRKVEDEENADLVKNLVRINLRRFKTLL